MRILVVIHEYPPVGGGGGRVAQDLCREMARRGHEMVVLTSHYRGLPRRENHGELRIVRVPAFRRQPYRADLLSMGAYIVSGLGAGLALVKNWQPDIIHVHFAVPCGPLAWAISRLTRIPYVLTTHLGDVPGGVPEKTEAWFRWLYPFTPPIWKNADRVVAVSRYTRQLALKNYPVDILFIPNGVNLKELDPGVIQVEGAPQIVFAGRFVPQKNLLHLVRVLGKIKQLAWQCVLLGDGPLLPAVEEEIKALGLEERVTITGWVSPEEVIRWLGKSDLLLMPSQSEGFPVVGVQAIAMGLAVVGSRVGGLVDLVEHGKNGFLHLPDDTAGMAASLTHFIEDPQALRLARMHSRELARQFDLRSIAGRYESLFSNVINQ